jgi:hypothetical protein
MPTKDLVDLLDVEEAKSEVFEAQRHDLNGHIDITEVDTARRPGGVAHLSEGTEDLLIDRKIQRPLIVVGRLGYNR